MHAAGVGAALLVGNMHHGVVDAVVRPKAAAAWHVPPPPPGAGAAGITWNISANQTHLLCKKGFHVFASNKLLLKCLSLIHI